MKEEMEVGLETVGVVKEEGQEEEEEAPAVSKAEPVAGFKQASELRQ